MTKRRYLSLMIIAFMISHNEINTNPTVEAHDLARASFMQITSNSPYLCRSYFGPLVNIRPRYCSESDSQRSLNAFSRLYFGPGLSMNILCSLDLSAEWVIGTKVALCLIMHSFKNSSRFNSLKRSFYLSHRAKGALYEILVLLRCSSQKRRSLPFA